MSLAFICNGPKCSTKIEAIIHHPEKAGDKWTFEAGKPNDTSWSLLSHNNKYYHFCSTICLKAWAINE